MLQTDIFSLLETSKKDVTNKVAESTRAQLKKKMQATKEEMLQYKSQYTWKLPDTDTTISNQLTGDDLIIIEPDDLIETNSDNK